MRILLSILTVLALPAVVLPAPPPPPVPDTRPFGKYLVQICGLTDGCHPPSASFRISDRTPDTITIKQVACAASVQGPCRDPVKYPLAKGDMFYISAAAASGRPIDLKMLSGNATPKQAVAGGVITYQVNGPGTIVINASIKTDPTSDYADPAPVSLSLTVGTDSGDGASCSGLLPASASQIASKIDPATIIGLIGNPTPFVLTAQGKDAILIYSTRRPPTSDEDAILAATISNIEQLVAQTPSSLGITPASSPFSVELQIPHARALGDPATRISGLNYSGLTVQDIGSDGVRITAPSQPECAVWTAFLTSIRRLEWSVSSEPFDMKLYYLSATDAAAAFNTLGAAAAGGASGGGAPAGGAAGGGAPGGGGAGGGAGTSAGNASIAVTQPPGSFIEVKSDTTPCVLAGLTLSNSSACAPAAGGSSSPSASTGGGGAAGGAPASTTPKPPPGMASMGVAAGATEQSFSDLLVFSDANAGDDAQITERKRILAQLDLPRPEMIVNAWIMQNSTANPKAMGLFGDTVKELVEGYNTALEAVVLHAWGYVDKRTHEPGYFDENFFHYINDLYVAEPYAPSGGAAPGVQQAAQQFLEDSPAKLADPSTRTNDFGICPANRYCLGFNTLFQPLRPRLTDFLLTLIAARLPTEETLDTIKFVEGVHEGAEVKSKMDCGKARATDSNQRDRCLAVWNNLGLDRRVDKSSCSLKDYQGILRYLILHPAKSPLMQLSCFREQANQYMSDAGAGFLRAAIADFLFNYKQSQQYTHEFSFYDLSQSADSLNTALAPLIDGFNQDILAFQTFMRADLQYQVDRLNNDTDQRCCAKRLFGLDKPSFFNDGLVTVRTISGQQTNVSTTSQSALDSSSAPALANLLNNIATPGGNSSAGASPLAATLGARAQPGASLLAGVLNSYQSSTVQVGRALNLMVTPRSLSTAASAEINVTLNADEVAGSLIYSGGPQGGAPQNTSRVASHDITSRIRVESVKLFELSSFSAVVERSRSRFPLLPPFVEIPYIGTLAGIPIPGAKEYHSSTAVISAMVVPTAADIAYGLHFTFDQVVDGDSGPCSFLKGSAGSGVAMPCRFRRAQSLGDLNKSPVRDFHQSMINCFATNMASPYSGFGSLTNPPAGACTNLTFDRVRHAAP